MFWFRGLSVLKTMIFALCFLALPATAAWGQALPTASRAGDLQLGGGFAGANPDYSPDHFYGFALYGDFDFKEHYGFEADFHQLSGDPTDQLYERTYEIGGRYIRHYRIFNPYAKAMIGRGVFNFPLPPGAPAGSQHPNLAYNIFGIGIGVDYRIVSYLNGRVEYEYQNWPGFPPTGLQPNVVTIGVAYHFQ